MNLSDLQNNPLMGVKEKPVYIYTKTKGRGRKIPMTLNGVTKMMSEWSIDLQIPITTLYWRHNHGWSDKKALSKGDFQGKSRRANKSFR